MGKLFAPLLDKPKTELIGSIFFFARGANALESQGPLKLFDANDANGFYPITPWGIKRTANAMY